MDIAPQPEPGKYQDPADDPQRIVVDGLNSLHRAVLTLCIGAAGPIAIVYGIATRQFYYIILGLIVAALFPLYRRMWKMHLNQPADSR